MPARPDTVDVGGLIPEARPIAARAAAAYLRHTGDSFVGLIAHGSAVKGGVIAGCSDLDLQLYVRDAALTAHGTLPLDVSIAIGREVGRVDLFPFQYVQCYPRPTRVESGWVGPIPGAYHVIAGELPVPEATADDLRETAGRLLGSAAPTGRSLSNAWLEPSGERLTRQLRLLCTDVWPTVYCVLTLTEADPLRVWTRPKSEAAPRLPEAHGLRSLAARFLAAALVFYPAQTDLAAAAEISRAGTSLLARSREWYATLRP